MFSLWEDAGVFHPQPGGPGESYSIAIPPPNVTGRSTWATR